MREEKQEDEDEEEGGGRKGGRRGIRIQKLKNKITAPRRWNRQCETEK